MSKYIMLELYFLLWWYIISVSEVSLLMKTSEFFFWKKSWFDFQAVYICITTHRLFSYIIVIKYVIINNTEQYFWIRSYIYLWHTYCKSVLNSGESSIENHSSSSIWNFDNLVHFGGKNWAIIAWNPLSGFDAQYCPKQ